MLIALNHLEQRRFKEWQLAPTEPVDLIFIVIQANDLVSEFGETRSRNEADMTGPDDSDILYAIFSFTGDVLVS